MTFLPLANTWVPDARTGFCGSPSRGKTFRLTRVRLGTAKVKENIRGRLGMRRVSLLDESDLADVLDIRQGTDQALQTGELADGFFGTPVFAPSDREYTSPHFVKT